MRAVTLAAVAARYRAARRHGGDAGVTLVELVVVLVLSTIVGAMTLALFVDVHSSTASTTDLAGSAQARDALQSWTAYLDVADSPVAAGTTDHWIEWAGTSDLLFYADIDNRVDAGGVATTQPPRMVWLRLDSDHRLVEEQFASTATAAGPGYTDDYATSPTVCRILADDVTALTFAPTTADGSSTGFGADPQPPAPGCVPRPSPTEQADLGVLAELGQVSSIGIDLTITATRGGRVAEYTSRAALPPLDQS